MTKRKKQLLSVIVVLIAAALIAWLLHERSASARLQTSATHAHPPALASGTHPLRAPQGARAPVREPTWYEAMQAEVAKLLGFAEPFAYVDVEVCGIGKERVRAVDAGLPPLLAIAVEQEWAAWREKLGQSANAANRVAVQFVDTLRVAANASTEFDRRSSGTQAEREESARISKQAAAPLAMALLESAKSSNDLSVIVAAMDMCGYMPGNACSVDFATRLTQVDPDNLYSWQRLASAAKQSGDEALRSQAIIRAAEAPRYETPPNPARHLLASEEFANLPEATRQRLSHMLLPLAFDTSFSQVELFSHCNPKDEWTDPGKAKRCRHFAEMLAVKDDLISPTLAAVLSVNAGWPPSRSDAMMNEREVLMNELTAMSAGAPYSCEKMKETEAYARDYARTGERTALRKRIEARGETMQQAVARVVEQRQTGKRK